MHATAAATLGQQILGRASAVAAASRPPAGTGGVLTGYAYAGRPLAGSGSVLVARAHGVEGRKEPKAGRSLGPAVGLEDSETVPSSLWAASMLERASAAVALV